MQSASGAVSGCPARHPGAPCWGVVLPFCGPGLVCRGGAAVWDAVPCVPSPAVRWSRCSRLNSLHRSPESGLECSWTCPGPPRTVAARHADAVRSSTSTTSTTIEHWQCLPFRLSPQARSDPLYDAWDVVGPGWQDGAQPPDGHAMHQHQNSASGNVRAPRRTAGAWTTWTITIAPVPPALPALMGPDARQLPACTAKDAKRPAVSCAALRLPLLAQLFLSPFVRHLPPCRGPSEAQLHAATALFITPHQHLQLTTPQTKPALSGPAPRACGVVEAHRLMA